MDNNENKKAPKELSDEELDAVAGGTGRTVHTVCCPTCHRYVMDIQAAVRGGSYYCPYCENTPLPLGKGGDGKAMF